MTQPRKRRVSTSRPSDRRLECLEPRLTLSAAPVGGLQDVVVLLNQSDAAKPLGKATVASYGGQLGHVYENVAGFSASLPDRAIDALKRNPNVLLIEPDLEAELLMQTIPTGIERSGAASNPVAAIDENSSTPLPFPFVFATIDTGVDVDHPELNVVGGVNFVHSEGDANFDDGNGHGSHVAGTMAAIDDSNGVVGLAPGAGIWAARAFGNNGRGSSSDILAAMDAVIGARLAGTPIAVVNMSFSMFGGSAAQPFLEQMANAGILISAAAGNSGGLGASFPASSLFTTSVAALADSDGLPDGLGPDTSAGPDDTIADFSNCCRSADIAAPGVDILSTWKGGGEKVISGTSMAAPHVAGAAGLFIAQFASSWSGGLPVDLLDTVVVREALLQTAVDGGDYVTRQDDPSEGEFVLRASGNWSTPSVVSITSALPSTISAQNTLTVDARDVDTPLGELHFSIELEDEDGTTTSVMVDPNDTQYVGPDPTDPSAPYGRYDLTWNVPDVPEGLYVLSVVTQVDNVVTSNPGARLTTNQITVAIDDGINSAPEINVIAPLASEEVNGTLAIQAEVTDDGTVGSVTFSIANEGPTVEISLSAEETTPATPTSPAVWTAFWDTTGVTNGSYTIDAVAVDDGDLEGTSSPVLVVVANDASTEGSLSVADLDGASVDDSGPFWYAIARVQVVNDLGVPVEGATVYGDWVSSGGSTAQTWSLTDAGGWIEHRFIRLRSVSSPVTFTVNRVEHPNYTYQPLLNSDPDGDSTITSAGEISIKMFEPTTAGSSAGNSGQAFTATEIVFAQFGLQGQELDGDLNKDGRVDFRDFLLA